MTELNLDDTGDMGGGVAGVTGLANNDAAPNGGEQGNGPLWGQSVMDTGPAVGGGVGFHPDRICIVLMRLQTDLKLYARRVYIDMPAAGDVETTIFDTLRVMRTGAPVNADDREGLNPIRLGGQRIVVFYLDNDPASVRFRYANDPALHGFTLRFVAYSGYETTANIRKNHAFFNVRAITSATPGGLSSRTAFRLDYWDTDELGEPLVGIDKDEPLSHYRYSLGILVEMANVTGGGWTPLIIDPDTGNMGAEP